MLKKAIFAGSLALMLGACNSSDTSGSGVRNLTDEDVRESGIAETWKSDCQNISLDLFGLAAQKEEYRIGGDIRKVTTYYETNECTDAIIEVQETGTYGNVDKSNDNWEIDINWKTVEMKPVSDRGSEILTTLSFCQFADWPKDQAQNITDKTSENPILDRCWTKTPRDQYDLFQIRDGVLYFGQSADKGTPEGRPTVIDESVAFRK
ncbi:MAG: hypothetical protein KF789_00565 [Bdellovibrionaceae bacterium]|nr:hypothetical protein [Pseudobdellovibrionaceae bacterium]